MKNKNLLFEKERKLAESIRNNGGFRYCKHCGHTVDIIHVKGDKVVCSWCHHFVFKDDKVEFLYRLNEKLKKKD